MIQGVQIEVEGGFAYIEFLDPAVRGRTLATLNAVAGPGFVDVDTSGIRKTYSVPESIARAAGLLPPLRKMSAPPPADAPAPARRRRAPKPPPAEEA